MYAVLEFYDLPRNLDAEDVIISFLRKHGDERRLDR